MGSARHLAEIPAVHFAAETDARYHYIYAVAALKNVRRSLAAARFDDFEAVCFQKLHDLQPREPFVLDDEDRELRLRIFRHTDPVSRAWKLSVRRRLSGALNVTSTASSGSKQVTGPRVLLYLRPRRHPFAPVWMCCRSVFP